MTGRAKPPTNAEMLADFSDTASQAFAVAVDRTLESPIGRAFEGKPLSSLRISFVRETPESPSIVAQELGVRTINTGDLPFLKRRPFEAMPEDVRDRFHELAHRMAITALSSRVSVAPLVPMEAIQTDYVEYTGSDTFGLPKVYREVRSFDARPVKSTIAAGSEFAEEALYYAQSANFGRQLAPAEPMGPHERIIRYGEGDSEDTGIRHYLGIDPSTPDLPLNGAEPLEFLYDYHRIMTESYADRQRQLQVIMELGGYDSYLDEMQESISRYIQTIKRIEDHIKRKSN